MTTPLYHASLAGVSGLAFRLASSTCFTPTDDRRVYVLTDAAPLVITAPVPDAMAVFLQATIVEPRLWTLGEEHPERDA